MNNNYRKVYAYKGIEVSERGAIRRAYDNKGSILGIPTYHNLSFKTDKHGDKIVYTKDYGEIRVDRLVCLAYRGNPKGGQKFIIHNDKDKTHCWKDNLRWASTYEYGEFYKDDPIINTPDGFRMIDDHHVYVSKAGEIKIDGKKVTLLDYLYDPDLDKHRATDLSFNCPYTNAYGATKKHRVNVDDCVAEAFIPKPNNMINPVVIHKNCDYKDCNVSNLEWVERTDTKYADYLKKRQIAIDVRNCELEKEFSGH